MKYARYVLTGDLISLRSLYGLLGEEVRALSGKPNSKAKIAVLLKRDIVCPECGMPVYAYGVNVLQGFHLAGQQVGNPEARPLTQPGFSHFPHNRLTPDSPTVECSLYLPMDPRFETLVRKNGDAETKERVRAVLTMPSVRKMNRNILNRLFYAAMGRSVTREEVEEFNRLAKDFYQHPAMEKYPWLLPFALIARKGVSGPNGFFIQRGEAYWTYHDAKKNVERVIRVPISLELMASKGARVPKNRFLIGEAEARRLGGVDEIPVRKKLVPHTRPVAATPQFLPGYPFKGLLGQRP